MSSEMRYSDDDLCVIVQDWSESDPDQAVAINLARECLRHRALLARTEAGAGGAVAWAYRSEDPYDGGQWMLHGPTWEGEARPDRREVVPLYTRPQDASGDAEVEVEWVVTSSCAGPNGHPKFDSEAAAFAHFAENSEIPSYLNPTRKRQAQVYVRRTELTDVTSKAIAAMQAKEAK